MLEEVLKLIHQRRDAGATESSYVASLFAKGENQILKKIGEEATEVVLAAKDGQATELVHEITDLWFHCLVLMAAHGLTMKEIEQEFSRRFGKSGLAEKAARIGT